MPLCQPLLRCHVATLHKQLKMLQGHLLVEDIFSSLTQTRLVSHLMLYIFLNDNESIQD